MHAVGGRLEFRHPLVRSAVYHAAPFAARARAHRTLAEVLTGEQNADRRAWHHAAGVLGTDEEAAAELEGTAGRAIERSGHAAASAALERAGELSPDEADRRRRLVSLRARRRMAGEQGARAGDPRPHGRHSPSRRSSPSRRCCAAGWRRPVDDGAPPSTTS